MIFGQANRILLPTNVALQSGRTIESPKSSRATVVTWLPAGALLLAWAILWQKLSVDWSVNDQYQYGWFVPPLALALFALRWRDRPAPQASTRALAWASAPLLILLLPALRLVEEPNGDWRLLFWAHAGVLTVASLAVAGWTGGWPWVRHFAFPTLFLLLAVPWPSGPEQALVQSLMRSVAAVASEGLNLLGLPAVPQGNLIRVRDQIVGVNEACSGIRSLQTVLMGALMLGELSRFSWIRRVLLIAGGVAVAMAANVFRSGWLVWIAARNGSAALAQYHDAAGLIVLVSVFGGLLGLAKLLDPGRRPPDAPPAPWRAWAFPTGLAASALAWIGLIELGTFAWYRAHELHRTVLPAWTVSLPTDAIDLRPAPMDDVTRALLRYDSAQTAHWPPPPWPPCTSPPFAFRPAA